MIISKQQAIELFGSSTKLGRALKLSRSAISQWPEELDQWRIDVVIGAALRLGKLRPISHEILIVQPKINKPFPI